MSLSENIASGVAVALDLLKDRVRKGMSDAPSALERAARDTLSGERSGRIYGIGSERYRASAPGEPPAARTGQYRASWHALPVCEEQSEQAVYFTAAISSDMPERAHTLENGGGNISARPHFERILESAAREILPRIAGG